MFCRKSIIALVIICVWSIPIFVYATHSEEEPSWEKVFRGVEIASNKTGTDPALLLGILRIESAYGTNIGESVAKQKLKCVTKKEEEYKNTRDISKDGFFGWTDKDINKYARASCFGLKELTKKEKEESIIINKKTTSISEIYLKNHVDDKGYYDHLLDFCDTKKEDCSNLKTSYTFALGFTQFQPDTWLEYKKAYPELINPWSYIDSLTASGYKIKNDAGETNLELVALGKYNSDNSYSPAVQLKKAEWQELFNKANKAYCNGNGNVSCTLEKLQSVFSEVGRLCTVLKPDKTSNFSCLNDKVANDGNILPQITNEEAQKQLDVIQKQFDAIQKQTEAKLTQEIPTIITSPNLGAIKTGSPYLFQLQVEGGKPPYVWSLYKESSPLPPGLSLSRDGRISGTPITAGTYNFVVQVEDGANWWKLGLGQGNVSTKIFSLAVEPGEEIVPTPTQSPEKKSEEKQVIPLPKEKEQIKKDQKQDEVKPMDDGQRFEIITSALAPSTATVNMPYSSALLTATGGKPPYEWSLYKESSPLPPGLSINKNGVIEGTPTKANTYNFTVEAKDNSGGWLGGLFGAGQRTTKIFTLVVNEAAKQAPPVVSPAPTPAPPPTPQNNNFEMSMNNSITVTKGDIALQEISVTIPDWNKDDVNFTVKDNIPPSPNGYITNPDYNFIPRSCKVSCKTILNINAISPEIPVGSFHVTVGTHSTNITSSFELKIIERTPPSAPTMRATAISSSQIKLDWSDNAAQDDALYIERKIESSNDYKYIHSELKRNLSSYVDPGLTPNTRYCYRIYFKNMYVPSPNYSQEQCATTREDTPPIPQGKPDLTITSLRAPTAANIGNGTLMLRDVLFTIVNRGPVSASRFVVGFYWSQDAIITLDDTKAKSFMLSGFGPGESRTIGKGGDVDNWGFDIPISSSLSPNTYYLGVIIDYTKEINEVGEYKEIFIEGGQVEESNETNNTRVADTGQIIVSGQQPPAPPTLLQPTSGVSLKYDENETYVFQWNITSDANNAQIFFFFNGECTGNNASASIFDEQKTQVSVRGKSFAFGSTYSWHVVARSNGVSSAPSECRTFSIITPTIPAFPTNLQVVLGNSDLNNQFVTLTWQDNATNETGFWVERIKQGGIDPWSIWRRTPSNQTNYTDAIPVLSGSTYCYRIKAANAANQFNGQSNEVCVTSP